VKQKICLAVTSIILATLFQPVKSYSQELYPGKDGSIRNIDARAVFAKGGEYYLATNDTVYRREDGKDEWESIFYLPAGENEINCIGGTKEDILIGTKRGLFRSRDRGATWRNVFRTITPEKGNILCINVPKNIPGTILIGTSRGIFISEDLGDRWGDISGVLKNSPVKCIVTHNGYIYAGADTGLYATADPARGWERVLVKMAEEAKDNDGALPDSIETEEEDAGSLVRCIVAKDKRLYAGAGKTVFYSDDGGKSWQNLSGEGLAGFVTGLLPSSKQDKLYCSTDKGIFEYSIDRSLWSEIYKGKDKNFSVSGILFDNGGEERIWAVTDKGLYKFAIGAGDGSQAPGQYTDIEKSLKTLKIIFDSEPSFKELQQAAIKYAEVSPEKIKNWRREARLKALFPKVSFSTDKNRSTNYEIYTSATKDYVIAGPDDISDGWDVSVSWELGDLIYSDDQTNIDVRSKLMVQLRNDILDDLRRVYYERKRIQFELAADPPKDVKVRFEKEMRLRELTQAIDDLTGNYLSERL